MKKIIVHGGMFHSDDVMCVALARTVWKGIKTERVHSVPDGAENDPETIVADIGLGRFDHHQPNARRRDDGSKYAACGLLFEELKDRIFPDEESAQYFEDNYIRPIERSDNGVEKNPFSCMIRSLNPIWRSGEKNEEMFEKAVTLAETIIRREIMIAESRKKAETIVGKAYEESDGEIVILEQYVPWNKRLISSDAKLVIYKSARGTVNLRTVPKRYESFEAKVDLPQKWIDEKTKGCSFVHDALFLAAFDSWENAKGAAKSILK